MLYERGGKKMEANKRENFINIVWLIFTIMGIIFLVVGIFFSYQTLIASKDNKVETTGKITQIIPYRTTSRDRGYDVYVSYVVEGQEYESRLNAYSSSFYEGKEIEIYYNKNNPHEIGSSSLDLLVLMFPAMGLLFAMIGGTGLFVKINKKRNMRKLKETGDIIHAKYVETIRNTAYAVNGMHPYNIVCEWNNPSDGKKYLFKSENIWANPEKIIEERNIETFPVYINPENMKKYAIDIDSITEDVVDLR